MNGQGKGRKGKGKGKRPPSLCALRAGWVGVGVVVSCCADGGKVLGALVCVVRVVVGRMVWW